MAEDNKVEGTTVSLDMDPESRRLFNVRKVLKGKKPPSSREPAATNSKNLTTTGGAPPEVLRVSSAENMLQKELLPR